MTEDNCLVADCGRPVKTLGYCNSHYARVRRTGDPQAHMPIKQYRPQGEHRPQCSVAGCDGVVTLKSGRGLCEMHYARNRRNGQPGDAAKIRDFSLTADQSFRLKYEVVDDCWLWTGALNACGYGIFRTGLAHRYAWEQAHGRVPPDMELDHLCHTLDATCVESACIHRRCVNPDHLEVVTHHENVLRGNSANRVAVLTTLEASSADWAESLDED